ncbi:hypothetical protein HN51_019891, partial [Arachis hypogaea]
PPRRQNKDKDEEVRNPRNVKPVEVREGTAKVIVNVVVSRTILLKSRNAVKRDVKAVSPEVLKVTSIPTVQFT